MNFCLQNATTFKPRHKAAIGGYKNVVFITFNNFLSKVVHWSGKFYRANLFSHPFVANETEKIPEEKLHFV